MLAYSFWSRNKTDEGKREQKAKGTERTILNSGHTLPRRRMDTYGQTTLTLISLAAPSSAAALVRPTRPCLEAA